MSSPPDPASKIKYAAIGAFTRDFHIAADGTLLFADDGKGVLGGGGSYAMTGARLWSPHIGIVGRFTDTYPPEWVSQIVGAGIDIRGLHRVQNVPAELVFGRYFPDGERKVFNPVSVLAQRGRMPTDEMIAWAKLGSEGQKNVIRELAPTVEDIPQEYFQAQAFHLAPMPYQEHLGLVNALRPYPILLTLDPGPHYMANVDSEQLRTLLTGVQVFMPSEGEVIGFFGAGAIMADCAKRLAELGPEIVAIKMSTRGSLVYERATDELHHIPIYATKTVDATGAGDSYCGGFMVGYAETRSARQAGLYGAVSASFIVQAPGALDGLSIEPAEVRARLQALEQQVAP
jgi:sugar/nucleoside kinase (ribokinase family)